MAHSHRSVAITPARRVLAVVSAFLLVIGWQLGHPLTAFADGPATFNNSASIAIPATGSANQIGPANPYPSSITVSGLAGAVSKVQVRFNGLSHTALNDVDALVVAPSGDNLVVLSDVGDPTSSLTFASDATLTFDDDAATSVPTGRVDTDSYRVTNNGSTDAFPAPAPTPSNQTTLAGAFAGIDPNGTWQLFVVDDTTGDVGSMSGGWSVIITTEVAAAATTTTVTSSDATSTTGSPVTFSATVRAAGTPVTTGTVQFNADGTNLGSPVAVSGSGTASLTTSALGEGTHLIRATFSGATGFLTSNGTVSQRVDNATTITGRTFCNAGPITVPGSGPATAYPSNIFVTGLTGPITKVTAQLTGLSHQAPIDFDILLSGPTSPRNLDLMSDSGGQNPVSNVNLTFDDAAAGPIGNSLASGTYLPTRTADETAENMPAPAPALSDATELSTFNGQTPNGTWSLWVVDDASGDSGGIAGGWCVTIASSAPTVTALTATPNPSDLGQSVTFSAAVTSGGSPVGSGVVQFSDGANPLGGPVTVDAGGIATLTTSALTTGTHRITASYGGSDTLQESSDDLNQVVRRLVTTTTLTSSENPSSVGDAVTFTATVTSGGAPLTSGDVTFSVDGTDELTTAVSAIGEATYTTSALTAGSHPIEARYVGTTTHAPSTASLDQVVDLLPSSTTLTSSANPSLFGASVTFTATVTSNGAPVTSGSVTFSIGGTDVSTVAVSAQGEASLSSSSLAAGTHPIEARYSGTASIAVSVGTLDQVVGQQESVTTVISSPNPADFGATVTLVASVTAGGAPVTAGTVQFSAGGTPVGPSLPVQPDGTVTITQAGLSPGTIVFTATFSGTADVDGSAGTVSQVINGRPSVTVLTGPASSELGEPVTFTATVTFEGAPVTSGSVVFSDNGTAISGEVGVDGSGQVTFTTPDLTLGDHPLTAAYTDSAGEVLASVSATLTHAIALTVTVGGPYTVAEGGAFTLAGTGSPGASYEWDLNDDAVFGDAVGLTPTLTWAQLEALGIDDGPSSHPITLRPSIGGALQPTQAGSLSVTNSAPDTVLTGDLTATVGQPFTIKVGADDPSSADMAAMFTYTLDWGDGSAVETVVGPADPPVTHTYTVAGEYAARFTATDKDGGTGSGRTVIVEGVVQEPSPTPTPSPTKSTGPNYLPQTGADADPNLLVMGLALVAVGALATVAGLIGRSARRRP